MASLSIQGTIKDDAWNSMTTLSDNTTVKMDATVTFIVRSIHPVRVVGNLAVLGQWSLQNSKKLRNDPVGSEQWVGYIKLDAELQQTIEFQFITECSNQMIIEKRASRVLTVCPGQECLVLSDVEGDHTVQTRNRRTWGNNVSSLFRPESDTCTLAIRYWLSDLDAKAMVRVNDQYYRVRAEPRGWMACSVPMTKSVYTADIEWQVEEFGVKRVNNTSSYLLRCGRVIMCKWDPKEMHSIRSRSTKVRDKKLECVHSDSDGYVIKRIKSNSDKVLAQVMRTMMNKQKNEGEKMIQHDIKEHVDIYTENQQNLQEIKDLDQKEKNLDEANNRADLEHNNNKPVKAEEQECKEEEQSEDTSTTSFVVEVKDGESLNETSQFDESDSTENKEDNHEASEIPVIIEQVATSKPGKKQGLIGRSRRLFARMFRSISKVIRSQ